MFKTINGGKIPTKATKFSAGVDVYANEDIVINAGETKLVGLGVVIDYVDVKNSVHALYFKYKYRDNPQEVMSVRDYTEDFMQSHYLALKPRSSLRAKGVISHSGVIDLDYTREIKMIIHNPNNNAPYHITRGDKIGQIMLMEHKSYLFSIESNEERIGGFGSTGNV